jgi:hypothetical protein
MIRIRFIGLLPLPGMIRKLSPRTQEASAPTRPGDNEKMW